MSFVINIQQTNKPVLIFGKYVMLSKDFINKTKLSTMLSGDVGEILSEIIEEVHPIYSKINLVDFKVDIISNIIMLINSYFIDENNNTHLLSNILEGQGGDPRKFMLYYYTILPRFGDIVVPIIDYLEIDDRLLIQSKDWIQYLLSLYEDLQTMEGYRMLCGEYDWRIVGEHKKIYKAIRYIALLERYVLLNNYKIKTINLLYLLRHTSNKIISMRTNL